MDIKVKLLRPSSRVPKYASDGAAACDLCADVQESIVIEPGERKMIPTGIQIEIPTKDVVALIYARSGLACKRGVHLANCVGVIDSDYRGELKVCLTNDGTEAYVVDPGLRIAQLCFTPVIVANLIKADDLSETDRGSGGFGSTGM